MIPIHRVSILLIALLTSAIASQARDIVVVAHRGANHLAPENTMAAAMKCVELGVDYVEIDVRTSRDGVFYILHDKTLDRTTNGTGAIAERDSSYIDHLDAGSWFGTEFEGERVPRLAPFLKALKGKIKIYFDVKDADLSELLKVIYAAGFEEDCFFWFSQDSKAQDLRALDSQIPLKMNATDLAGLERVLAYNPQLIEYRLENLSPEFVEFARKRNLKLMAHALMDGAENLYQEILDSAADMVNLDRADIMIKLARPDATNANNKPIIHSGLVYSQVAPNLTLDLFMPTKRLSEKIPCVVLIQGGGFKPQDGQRFRPHADYFAAHGFAAALISYRGRPNNDYQDTISDTKTAVRFIRKVSAHYNIDPNRIGVMGSSAGGALAGLLAVTDDLVPFEGEKEHEAFSSRIQAAATMAGVFNLISRFTDKQQIALQPRLDTKLQSNGEWIAAPFSINDEHWLRASCVNHIDKDDPPILLIHCKDDPTVPWLQSQEMHEAMTEAGIASEIFYYETGGHGFKGHGDDPKSKMVQFFNDKL